MEPREAVPRKWGRGGGLKATRNLQRESLGGGAFQIAATRREKV